MKHEIGELELSGSDTSSDFDFELREEDIEAIGQDYQTYLDLYNFDQTGHNSFQYRVKRLQADFMSTTGQPGKPNDLEEGSYKVSTNSSASKRCGIFLYFGALKDAEVRLTV